MHGGFCIQLSFGIVLLYTTRIRATVRCDGEGSLTFTALLLVADFTIRFNNIDPWHMVQNAAVCPIWHLIQLNRKHKESPLNRY